MGRNGPFPFALAWLLGCLIVWLIEFCYCEFVVVNCRFRRELQEQPKSKSSETETKDSHKYSSFRISSPSPKSPSPNPSPEKQYP